MQTLDKKEKLIQLFNKYQNLLTEKQVLYFTYYFYDDYSLHEIAEIAKVSRHAVYDQLKKVENHLFDYENKLKLLENSKKRNQLIQEIKLSKDLKLLDDIGKLDE